MSVLQVIRRVGIAIGSVVAAALAVGLVCTVLGFGAALDNGVGLVAVVILGGLIYRDILRREQRGA